MQAHATWCRANRIKEVEKNKRFEQFPEIAGGITIAKRPSQKQT